MKRPFLRPLLPALACAVLALAPRDAAALSCDDIMSMVNVNVPTNIVVQTIKDSGETFSDADIACLQDGGASGDVVAQARRQIAEEEPRALDRPQPQDQDLGSMDSDEDLISGHTTRRDSNTNGNVDLSEGPATRGAPREVEKAIDEYKSKKYLSSSLRLYEALQSGNYSQATADIDYYLGRDLEALEMYHAAQYHYASVVRKYSDSQYFEYSLPRLVAIAEFTGDDTELASLISRGSISPERAPRQAQDHLYFLEGVRRYKKEDLSGARAAFAQVDANSVLGLKAKYFEGVIYNQQGKLKSAVRSFRDVYRADVDPRTDRESADLARLVDLALINIARIYYGIERYDESAKYYDLVSRDSPYWAEATFENAWANFMLNDLNKSLGLLLTTRSPFFRDDTYEPEAVTLRALTYFNLCEYPEVERILLGFEDDYRPQYEEMRDFVQSYSSREGRKIADEAWDTYFGSDQKDSVLPKGFFDRVLRNQDLLGVVRHLRIMDDEETLIDKQKERWKQSLAPYLKQIITKDRRRLKRRAGLLLLSETAEQANYLNDKLTQSEIIRFEVVDAQRVDYSYKASNVELADSASTLNLDFATSVEFIYWPFNGEYWADELGYYQYTEQGSCN